MSRFRYTLLINWFIDWLIHWRLIFEESSLQNWSFIGDGDTEAPGESRAGEVPPSLVPVFLKKYFINSNLLFNSVIWQHDSIESKTVPFKKNIAMLYGEGTYFEGKQHPNLKVPVHFLCFRSANWCWTVDGRPDLGVIKGGGLSCTALC